MKRVLLIFQIFLLLIFSLSFTSCDTYEIIETNDIKEYGNFRNTKYGVDLAEYAKKVMPEKVENFFTSVEYSYKMCHSPAMHEAYLKVTIESDDQYDQYLNSVLDINDTQEFYYDKTLKEYVIRDIITLHNKEDEDGPRIGYSEIQKILFSTEENTIIVLSLVIPDNDMPFKTDTFLYFDEFDIDPRV